MIVRTSSNTDSAAGKAVATFFFGIFAVMGLVFTVLVVRAEFETVRPYFWNATECVIESSAANDRGTSFDFTVRYTYRVDGRTHTGTRFRRGMTTTMDAEAAQRAAQRYAAGNRATCYVNPSSPDECTIERGSLWSLLIVFFPLIFVAVGMGGIIAAWRKKTSADRPFSQRRQPGGRMFLRIFGLAFMAIGGGVVNMTFIQPALRESAAAKWPQVPCEILSSRIASHAGSKGGTTYSVEMRYRYTFEGKPYTGSRFNFDSGSSSSLAWRQEAVAKFKQGMKTNCRVNPQDPVDSVISLERTPDRWLGLIPGVFFVVGLIIFLAAPAMTKRTVIPSGLPAAAVNLPIDPVTGEIELKPASTPVFGCIFLSVFALFWNGIVSAFFWNIPPGQWGARIFLGVFALIGLVIALAAVGQFLALFNPRPILTASAGAVPLGGTLEVRWRFTGNVRRLVKLAITLEAREEATYRRGTTTTTDRNVFAILPLLDTDDRVQIAGGTAKAIIPENLMHTFAAPNNRIVWTLRLAGGIPRWPDVNAEFPITVLPRETAALSNEENPAT